MKKKNKKILNNKGLTLIEVIVAITILLMAAEIISISVAFTARMNTRSSEIFKANEEVGKKIQDESEGMTGTMSMKIKENEIYNRDNGWIYSEKAGKNADGFEVSAMWADDSVMTDLYKRSGAEAPELSNKSLMTMLPEAFPTISDQGNIYVMDSDQYVQVGEDNGTIVFLNSFADAAPKPSFVDLGSMINISGNGTYTSSGVTVMAIGDVSLEAGRINLWMEAEVYYLYGKIECTYTAKQEEVVPIHMYLVPQSGHQQPALVYVEEGTSINFYRESEDGTQSIIDPERTVEFKQSGWYAIPSDGKTGSQEEQAANARDLFKIPVTGGWDQYRLVDGNEVLGPGAVDKAYARLILAGLIESPRGSQDDAAKEE